jgi:hypothetical protein
LAPFIAHYNRHTGASYEFQQRLDVGSHTPQPEALYVDTQSGEQLVVERKNLIWPPKYAQIHDSLHMVTSIIGATITPHLEATKPYEFTMPDSIRGPLTDLRRHAEQVGETIIRNLDDVHAGKTVRSRTASREWSFRMEGIHERDWDEPNDGIRYVFNGSISPLDWGDIPEGLASEFTRLLESVKRKFTTHVSAKRVLVIDFHGDLHHPGLFIEQLFALVTIPSNVDEIWMSTYTFVTELHYGWIHRQLWPKLGEPASELSGETVVSLG